MRVCDRIVLVGFLWLQMVGFAEHSRNIEDFELSTPLSPSLNPEPELPATLEILIPSETVLETPVRQGTDLSQELRSLRKRRDLLMQEEMYTGSCFERICKELKEIEQKTNALLSKNLLASAPTSRRGIIESLDAVERASLRKFLANRFQETDQLAQSQGLDAAKRLAKDYRHLEQTVSGEPAKEVVVQANNNPVQNQPSGRSIPPPENCLASLNANQTQFLSEIDRLAKDPATTDQMLTDTFFNTLNKMDLKSGEKEALTALATGRVAAAREQAKNLDPEGPNRDGLNLLKAKDAVVGGKNGISLAGLKTDDLAKLTPTLAKLFPESKEALKKISDPDSRSPLFLGNDVVMPLSHGKPQKILSLQEYQTAVKNNLENFSAAFRQYVAESKEAASGFNSARSGFFSEPSQASKNADRFYELSVRAIDRLEKEFGYPAEKAKDLRNILSKAINEDNKDIAAGLRQFELASAAIIAAPLAWPALALGGAGAISGFAIGLGLTGLDIGVTAGIDTYYNQGGLLCNLGKQVLDKGPTGFLLALSGGPAGKVIAGGTRFSQSSLMALGLSEKAAQFAARGSIGALLAAPGGFQIFGGIKGNATYTKLADEAEAQGDKELAQEFRRLASQAKASAANGIVTTVALPYLGKKFNQRNPASQEQVPSIESTYSPKEVKQIREIASRISAGRGGAPIEPAELHIIGQRRQEIIKLASDSKINESEALSRLNDAGVLFSGANGLNKLAPQTGPADRLDSLHVVLSKVVSSLGGARKLSGLQATERSQAIEAKLRELYKIGPGDGKVLKAFTKSASDLVGALTPVQIPRYRSVLWNQEVGKKPLSIKEAQELVNGKGSGGFNSTGTTPDEVAGFYPNTPADPTAQKRLVLFEYPPGTQGSVINGRGPTSQTARDVRVVNNDNPGVFVDNEIMVATPPGGWKVTGVSTRTVAGQPAYVLQLAPQ